MAVAVRWLREPRREVVECILVLSWWMPFCLIVKNAVRESYLPNQFTNLIKKYNNVASHI